MSSVIWCTILAIYLWQLARVLNPLFRLHKKVAKQDSGNLATLWQSFELCSFLIHNFNSVPGSSCLPLLLPSPCLPPPPSSSCKKKDVTHLDMENNFSLQIYCCKVISVNVNESQRTARRKQSFVMTFLESFTHFKRLKFKTRSFGKNP